MPRPLAHASTLQSVSVHRPLPARRGLIAAAFVACWAVAISYAVSTAGQPYAVALAEKAKLAANRTNATTEPDGGTASKPAAAAALGEAKAAAAAAPDAAATPSASAPKAAGDGWGDGWDEGWEDDLEFGAEARPGAAGAAGGAASAASAANGSLALNASEAEAFRNLTESERPLPHEWLPSALSCALLFFVSTANALFYLAMHWSIRFKAKAVFASITEPVAGAHLYFVPHKHKGRGCLVPLATCPVTSRLTCEFQRQRYEVLPLAEALADADADAEPLVGANAAKWAVRLVRCPDREPYSHYVGSSGLADDASIRANLVMFGPNMLSVPTPRFVDLYVEQLLSPLAIFQLFTSALWLLDAVSLGFTAFNVFTILLLESTSVFQRQRTLKTLSQMAAKPYTLRAYRKGAWVELLTTDLLPGDLISLPPKRTAIAAAAAAAPNPKAPPAVVTTDVVPCDCVLLRGTAVVNEASLTGESVPQMKDRLSISSEASGAKRLAPHAADRVHTLFAGTTLIASTAGDAPKPEGGKGGGKGAAANGGVPATPDGGPLVYVLRSGFNSSQGELMQMVEFSQQKITDDSKETLLALLILLIFALIASAYVFNKGLAKGDRTTHELLLKCANIPSTPAPARTTHDSTTTPPRTHAA